MASRTLRNPNAVPDGVSDEELEELLNRPLFDNETAYIETERARIIFERREIDTENNAFQNEPEHTFQARGYRTKLDKNEVGVLKPGDHVAWHRSWIIWHHAIVLQVDRTRKKLLVIHWQKVGDRSKEWRIVEQWIDSVDQDGEFYRIDYEPEITENNPTALVLYRARCDVGKTNYKALKNNCETFATYCKTGKREGCQENWFWKQVKEAVFLSVSKNADTLVKAGLRYARELSSVTLVEVGASTGSVSMAETIEKLSRATDIVGAAIVVAIEGGFMIWDISRMYERRQDGRISRKDFIGTATQRFCEALLGAGLAIGGTFGGAAFGGALGGLVGSVVPIVGTAIGASVAAYLGSVLCGALGSISGRALGSLVGPYVGQAITCFIKRDDRAVNNISDISRGDHLVFCPSWYHPRCHAIATDIHVNNNTILVIRSSYSEGVIEEWIMFQTPIYKVIYSTGDCFNAETVIVRATSKLGQNNYDIIFSNCKHFACWCKAG